jgi:hypothetical protein
LVSSLLSWYFGFLRRGKNIWLDDIGKEGSGNNCECIDSSTETFVSLVCPKSVVAAVVQLINPVEEEDRKYVAGL